MLDAGCWILDTGCWILDAGYWMKDKARRKPLGPERKREEGRDGDEVTYVA